MSANDGTGACTRRNVALTLLLAALLLLPATAWSATPLTYLVGYGARNGPVVALIWGLIAISIIVTVVVTVLLLGGLFRRRPGPRPVMPGDVPLERPSAGLQWIYIGSAITAVVLFGTALWTFAVLAAITMPDKTADFRINVTGHQWWWEIRYQGKTASQGFTTANEIHIPVGQPVHVELWSNDVIHSFWVPELTGKTDTVPGQHNETWLEADRPGVYRGQCTEYCGQQHAHMGLTVVAQEPADFQKWWDGQVQVAPAASSPQVAQGQTDFIVHCGICHTVRGTQAQGRLGPDLTHIMSRSGLAAETLPNTIGYLSGWISDPQRIKPGNQMPTLTLSGPQLTSIRTFLETLK